MIVGVAGKYCSGKSTVTGHLVGKGFFEINLDKVGHRVLEESVSKVTERFGRQVLSESGSIDRKKLGAIVFADSRKRYLLEEILHPLMVRMVESMLSDHTGENIVIDGALLFYMGIDVLCDCVFWIRSPFFLRFHRARKRDCLSLSAVIKRFRAQAHLTPQPSKNDVDIYYINNTCSPAALKERIDRILP